jgi:hypothetical protein
VADRLLHALAEAFDDLDRPLQIRMRHAPHDAAQRLLDTFGALVVIDLSAPPCAERCNHKECRMSAAAIVFEPNWISYRHSLVQVDKRRDADDETLEICAYCECEVDVDPAPHKPGCRGIGAPRANPATSRRRRSCGSWPPRSLPQDRPPEPEDHDLLDAIDAGDPLTPDDEDELELDEEAAGPNASSSSPELEEEEVAAVGDLTGSGSAEHSSEPERAVTASSRENPYGLSRYGRGYKWTPEIALRACRDFCETTGRPPQQQDARDEPTGTLPSEGVAIKLFGSWDDMLRAADLTPVQARAPRNKTRTASRAADKRPAAAAAPSEPEPRDDHERDDRAVDASPPAAVPAAPASRSDGANSPLADAPAGDIRPLVLAVITAARAFADTLERELAAAT